MSRGGCMTRAPVVRVRGGWGGTHLRYLAGKSAVRYWAITILPLDSSLTLMEWVGEVFMSVSTGGWQIWEGVPPPQLLLVCYEQLPRTIQGGGISARGCSFIRSFLCPQTQRLPLRVRSNPWTRRSTPAFSLSALGYGASR